MKTKLRVCSQRPLPFPPRMTRAESKKYGEHYRLAQGFVRRYGWKYVNLIDYEEQISACEMKLCEALPKFNKEKAAISTFVYACCRNHLASMCTKLARVPVRFGDLVGGGVNLSSDYRDYSPLEVPDFSKMLSRLNPLPRRIIEMYVGRGEEHEYPVAMIARRQGITVEQTRDIIDRTLAALRLMLADEEYS